MPTNKDPANELSEQVAFDLSEISQTDALENMLRERVEWQRIVALETEQQLDVYLDLKSPHAYLAVRPSLAVGRDYRVKVNFLPFTLSYEAFGLTTRVDEDMQRRPPSAAADRKARMYYTAAREYARLQGLPFRTPHRLLDSDLAHKCFLFAKNQGLEVPFIMHVYLHGWGSGWRAYELESLAHLSQSLRYAGVNLAGLETFLTGGGPCDQQLAAVMQDAVASGYAGLPHFVMTDVDQGRLLGLFGREHLALIRSKFHAQGLARSSEVVADFSHAWSGLSART